jgi:hypothetical protein
MNWMKTDEDDAGSRISSLGGYLWKLKQGQRLIVPQWNKRWFSIEGKYLRYYEYANSEECSGTIDLSTLESVQRVDSVVQGAFSFCMTSPDRKYVLRATSNAEVSKWVRALRSQADLARGGNGMGIIFDSNTPDNSRTVAGKGKRTGGNSGGKSLESELDNTLERLRQLEKGVLGPGSSSSASMMGGSNAIRTRQQPSVAAPKSAPSSRSRELKDDYSIGSEESFDDQHSGYYSSRQQQQQTRQSITSGALSSARSEESLGDIKTSTPIRTVGRSHQSQSSHHENSPHRHGNSNERKEDEEMEAELFRKPRSRPPSSSSATTSLTLLSSRPTSAEYSDKSLHQLSLSPFSKQNRAYGSSSSSGRDGNDIGKTRPGNRYVGYEDDDDDSELGHAYRSKYSHK